MRGVIADGGEMILVDDLEVRSPGDDEVAVRVVASGLCRSDLLPLDKPSGVPMVLGHEASGVIEAVGCEVPNLHVGELVTVSCPVPCGVCASCTKGLFTACPKSFGLDEQPFTWRGRPVNSLARVSSLAELIVVKAEQAHPVHGLDPAAAALIGCAVSTGYGTTLNVAELRCGETVLVVGVGGIGINSIQAARLIGAAEIIAVDVNPAKEPVARRFGADRFVGIAPGRSAEQLAAELESTAGRVDAVIDCTGLPSVVEAAQRLLLPGGRVALVGMAHGQPTAVVDLIAAMYNHITIRGALNGACDPYRDLPEIIRLAEAGQLDLAGQVSHRWPLAQIGDAIAALRAGDVVRIVVDMC